MVDKILVDAVVGVEGVQQGDREFGGEDLAARRRVGC
jgi:hypothetical protein